MCPHEKEKKIEDEYEEQAKVKDMEKKVKSRHRRSLKGKVGGEQKQNPGREIP